MQETFKEENDNVCTLSWINSLAKLKIQNWNSHKDDVCGIMQKIVHNPKGSQFQWNVDFSEKVSIDVKTPTISPWANDKYSEQRQGGGGSFPSVGYQVLSGNS